MEENFIVNLINKLMPDRNLRGNSVNLANWMSVLLPNTCRTCVVNHGRIVDIAILDINYERGFRNRERILYSNDGLMFATYDHYNTFYEIID